MHLEACKYCETAAEALKVMQQASESKEVIDFCRLLVDRRTFSPTSTRTSFAIPGMRPDCAAYCDALLCTSRSDDRDLLFAFAMRWALNAVRPKT